MARKKKETKKLIWEEKENKEEGCNMTNKKIETNLCLSVEENEEYNWIGFELDGKYYMGFESSTELQAIIVSKNFFQAFSDEFKTS